MWKTLFREISLKVHPDMSSHSPSASTSRMQEVLRWKESPHMLLSLARKWELDIDFTAYGEPELAKKEIFEAIVGALIVTKISNKDGEVIDFTGIISKIRKINSGRFKGGSEFTIFNSENERFATLKTHENQPFDSIIRMVDDEMMNTIRDLMITNNINPGHGDLSANQIFSKMGLRNYYKDFDGSTKIRAFYKGAFYWFTVDRTSAKMVYTKNGPNINIKNVVEAKDD